MSNGNATRFIESQEAAKKGIDEAKVKAYLVLDSGDFREKEHTNRSSQIDDVADHAVKFIDDYGTTKQRRKLILETVALFVAPVVTTYGPSQVLAQLAKRPRAGLNVQIINPQTNKPLPSLDVANRIFDLAQIPKEPPLLLRITAKNPGGSQVAIHNFSVDVDGPCTVPALKINEDFRTSIDDTIPFDLAACAGCSLIGVRVHLRIKGTKEHDKHNLLIHILSL